MFEGNLPGSRARFRPFAQRALELGAPARRGRKRRATVAQPRTHTDNVSGGGIRKRARLVGEPQQKLVHFFARPLDAMLRAHGEQTRQRPDRERRNNRSEQQDRE